MTMTTMTTTREAARRARRASRPPTSLTLLADLDVNGGPRPH